MSVGAVEEFLDKAVRALACRAVDTRGSPIKVNANSQKMYWDVVSEMRYGVGLPLDLNGLAWGKPSVT